MWPFNDETEEQKKKKKKKEIGDKARKKLKEDSNSTSWRDEAIKYLRNYTMPKEEEKKVSSVSLRGTISKVNRRRKELEEASKYGD
jgi:hypothetical protein